jgi:SAM-dependent methyltransferase
MNLYRLSVSVFLSAIFTNLIAQEAQIDNTYKPHAGQEGKDVVWVPTPEAQVETMLDLAKVTSQDFVIDLGSGDGRMVIAAAKRGANSEGVEFDPDMVELSRKNAAGEGVSDKVEFVQGDLFKADLSRASVVTLFLLPEINLKLRPALLDLTPGTRIVSNTFQMDEWIPDSTVRTEENCQFWCDAYLWIIPAKVCGTWQMLGGELKLDQKFQKISGVLKKGRKTKKISEGRLHGNQITFKLKDEKYSGIVSNEIIEGTVSSGQHVGIWSAIRNGI